MLSDYGLASHWSCTHSGYATCVGYGYLQTPKKQKHELDDDYECWAPPGHEHPPLSKASRAPVTAKAIEVHTESCRQKQSSKGKDEKFTDIDLWPIVVRENILDTPEAPEVVMAYAKRCGGMAMVTFCFRQFNKLPELISRCWKVERVEEYVEKAFKSRWQILCEAQAGSCTCCSTGEWLAMAAELFHKNSISQEEWRQAMLHSMKAGRSKGTLVCHAGHSGNEGKSWLFEALELIFGEDFVFTSPPKGAWKLKPYLHAQAPQSELMARPVSIGQLGHQEGLLGKPLCDLGLFRSGCGHG